MIASAKLQLVWLEVPTVKVNRNWDWWDVVMIEHTVIKGFFEKIPPLHTVCLVALIGLGVLIAQAPAATAGEATVTARYKISYLGVSVGTMKNTLTASKTRYAVSGGAQSNSVVSLVANARAKFKSSGAIVGDRVIPDSHNLSYRSSKKKGKLNFVFSDGGIAKMAASPKIKYKRDAIPVEQQHLQNVLDPVSSLIFPVEAKHVGRGDKVCNRVLPIFDGRSRVNLEFSYKSKSVGRAEGFSGEVFHCAVRYRPIAGIRPNKKNVKFMAANRDIEVTMARIGDSNAYGLFAFNLATNKGRTRGKAYEFQSR